MAKIVNVKEKKLVDVRNLKNVKIPGYDDDGFFVHKTLGGEGFTLTHKESGCAVVQNCDSVKSAVSIGTERVTTFGKRSFYISVGRALEATDALFKKGV